MAKKIYEFTPFGTVTWASVQKPAKVQDGPNGPKPDEYQVRIELAPEEMAKWEATMKKHAANFTFKSKNPKLGISVNEETGKVTLMGKSQYKPGIFDSKNNKIDEAKIGNGSIVRMNCALNVYDKGISLVLSQVQVKKLVEYSSGASGVSAFGAVEDGYEAEGGSSFPAEADEKTTSADVDALGI